MLYSCDMCSLANRNAANRNGADDKLVTFSAVWPLPWLGPCSCVCAVPGAWCADSALPSAGLWLELAATPTQQCTLALGQGEEHS